MKMSFKKAWKIFSKAFWITLGILALTGLITFIVIILQAPELQDEDVVPSGYLTTVVDSGDQPVLSLADSESNRVAVDISQVPETVQNAFVAIEDARFYMHHGIDLKGIFRAAYKGITNGFQFTEGASTITQQLLKNNVFTEWMEEENFWDQITRKIQEQYLALRLESSHDKDWILINYLNTINLGGGTRGIQVAAQYYFGKDVWNLTTAEGALLAAIPKSPTKYNPFKNPEEAKARQELVLEAMRDQNYLTEEEYQKAMAEDVLSHLDVNHEIQGATTFNWFMDAMLLSVVEDLENTYDMENSDAWNLIYSGGLTIHSTQNTALQNIVEACASDSGLFADEEQQTSIVMLDNQTGAVVAIAGGRGEKTASLVYDRATDAIRQPGSTIKVIGEYALALEQNKITLGTTVDDAPYTYSEGTEIHNSYDYYNGMMTVRRAIADSSNVVALQVFQKTGARQVLEQLQNLGITTLDESDEYEALAIGGTTNGVTNVELAAAYHTLADDGRFIKAYYYTEVTDHDGRVILSHQPDSEKTQVVSEDTAALLTSAMEDVITSGTGQPCYLEGRSLAGKSGTTNDMRDLWFVGYSSYYTLSVWCGYDDNRAQSDPIYVKNIWRTIMERGHDGLENHELDTDSDLVPVMVCTKCGNLSEANVCNVTLQGDMTAMEYYSPGTEPKESCTCHESVTICSASGKIANDNCPSYYRETKVYLKSGTAGTADEAYVKPADLTGTCSVHKRNWWESFWNTTPDTSENTNPDNSDLFETPEQPGENSDHDQGGENGDSHSGGSSWKDIFDWFW